jgi:hypothetical protein
MPGQVPGFFRLAFAVMLHVPSTRLVLLKESN